MRLKQTQPRTSTVKKMTRVLTAIKTQLKENPYKSIAPLFKKGKITSYYTRVLLREGVISLFDGWKYVWNNKNKVNDNLSAKVISAYNNLRAIDAKKRKA